MFHIEILKKLGEGVFGTTFLINYINKKEAVIKLEKIDIEEHENSYWRQIQFDQEIAQFHKDLFLTIQSHGIIQNCGPEFRRKVYKKKETETYPWILTYGVFIVYTPVLETNVYPNLPLSLDQIKVNFLRVARTFDILKKNKYIHGDAHLNNWMLDKEGLLWLIDYGTITKTTWSFRYNSTFGIEMDVVTSLFLFIQNPLMTKIKPGIFFYVDYYGVTRIMNDSTHSHLISEYISDRAKGHKNIYQSMLEILLILFDWPSYVSCVYIFSQEEMEDLAEPQQPCKLLVLYAITQIFADSYTDWVQFAKKQL